MGGANPNTEVNQYPVISSKDAGVDEYFKANPQVSGMAWGGGLNGSPKDTPRSVVVNPYNIYLNTPQDTNNLIQNERIRHQMDENKWSGDFEITPEQQKWSQSLGAYANNPEMLKQTIVARLATGEYVPNPTEQQNKAAQSFYKQPTTTMGGANLPQQQSIPANLTEEQNAERIYKQGMSDQGIVSLGEGVKEIKGVYNDLKKGVIDPAVNAGKKAAIGFLEADKKVDFPIPAIKEKLNAMDDKMIKYLGGTPNENTSIDAVRYDRDATGSEFKGVKAEASPKKSIFNITAEEAMRDL
jgi:hypothetical protein